LKELSNTGTEMRHSPRNGLHTTLHASSELWPGIELEVADTKTYQDIATGILNGI